MSIIVNENTRVVVRGINRDEGLFHTSQMLEYGTKIFGGDMLNFTLIPETFLSE